MYELGKYLYYMAPIQNTASIVVNGIVSYNRCRNEHNTFASSKSIADPFVNSRRDGKQLDGRPLHDYVPLYWTTHTPMQYVVTMKEGRLPQRELIFFILHADAILSISGVISTDGNAASGDTKFFRGQGALEHIDWSVVQTRNCYSREYKRKKCAEVLVPDHIPASLLYRVCVIDNLIAESLRNDIGELGGAANSTFEIVFDPALYY